MRIEGSLRLLLLVENNEDDAQLVVRACGSISPTVSVIHARTALEALDLFGGTEDSAAFYDLMILAEKLPGISGFELLASLKVLDPTRSVPIVFFVAVHQPGFAQKVFAEGAVACVEKPIGFDEYLLTVSEIVSARTGSCIRTDPDIPDGIGSGIYDSSSAP